MNPIRVYWLTCLFLILAATATATTIVMPSDDQLIAKSPVIVKATVVRSGPVDRPNGIWTETVLSVDQALKGDVSGQLTVRERGGQIGDRITKIFGAPDYAPGEHVLAFLIATPRGDYQTMDLFAGKFGEGRAADGTRLWIRDDAGADVALLDSQFRAVKPGTVQRDAAGFERFIADRVAGKASGGSYIRDAQTASRRIAPDFTLISEPAVYRWFVFDTGGSASWRSFGTQPGYSGGGMNEISTAMGAWNNYASAKIRYTSGGAESSHGCMQGQNGINEVLFNDPCQDIAGTWNGSSGVVGLGGFNGVVAGGSWTSPFTADASHTQKTYNAWAITEANLTIQDNVSPGAGIPSSVLAEIVAHEFGHTLGLGHSTDSTALMYPTVTGLGPTLRPDDQLAARWLYPNGGGSTPPPPPPPPPAPAPVAAFTFTPSNPTTSTTITFTDQSSNATSWQWSFGDGTSSSQRNPTKRYAVAGSYNITLTASNGSQSSSVVHSVSVASVTPVTPPPVMGTYRSLVSVAAQTNGAGGSVWRTELTIFNAGNDAATVHLTFVPGPGTSILTRDLVFGVHQSSTYSNALLDLFGLATGAGAITIEATSYNSTPQLKVSSRTFTDGAHGTYGQAVPDVSSSDLQQTLYLTGLESDGRFRTNIGLVNKSSAPVAATLTIVDPDGKTLGYNVVTIPANNFQQSSLAGYFAKRLRLGRRQRHAGPGLPAGRSGGKRQQHDRPGRRPRRGRVRHVLAQRRHDLQPDLGHDERRAAVSGRGCGQPRRLVARDRDRRRPHHAPRRRSRHPRLLQRQRRAGGVVERRGRAGGHEPHVHAGRRRQRHVRPVDRSHCEIRQ